MSRIIVNLTDKSDLALENLAMFEGGSKTDAVNRAIQVYAFLVGEIMSGKNLQLMDSSDGTVEMVHII
jgi:hypothetical protein